ncbi:MAG: UDP-N-acetylenolpyruvoylglucosamine reductase [Candidatus Pelagibacter sp.]|nr:UDP-N-acetylenolpyruvoylglucosamine reductase [Candidatus Pelagibacter sp.]OUV87830.1 MAG: UDP-N-acetylenolpyruvoylglucosamine reductase [Pelagibacteraceae bacterium TMED136]|tara:strand:+ start:13707 stop:14567 length:861 start_codon:yes stop_codon:yes gene_type:complete
MSNLILDYNLSDNSWFGLGGKAKKFFSPNTEKELISYIKNYTSENFITIGSGSNILFRDKGCSETIIKLGKNFRKIKIVDDLLFCGSGSLKNQVSKFALDNEIKNMEFLSCIPGTMGGGVFMNAGCFGYEFKDIIKEVHGIDKNLNKIVIKAKNINFNYRKTDLPNDFIITELVLNIIYGSRKCIEEKITKFKKEKKYAQPSKIKTGGSTFKNPNSNFKAWELIKKSGCDKVKFGNVKFSCMHCNFIENHGNSGKDVEDLINYTIDQVKKKFNIILEPEIKIIGDI